MATKVIQINYADFKKVMSKSEIAKLIKSFEKDYQSMARDGASNIQEENQVKITIINELDPKKKF